MSPIWENYRQSDGTLDVVGAFLDFMGHHGGRIRRALDYLSACGPVTKPLAADIVFAHACELVPH